MEICYSDKPWLNGFSSTFFSWAKKLELLDSKGAKLKIDPSQNGIGWEMFLIIKLLHWLNFTKSIFQIKYSSKKFTRISNENSVYYSVFTFFMSLSSCWRKVKNKQR